MDRRGPERDPGRDGHCVPRFGHGDLEVARAALADFIAAAFSEVPPIESSVSKVVHVLYRVASIFYDVQASTRVAVLAVPASPSFSTHHDCLGPAF